MDSETAQKLIEQVTDERSFCNFLKTLREDYEATERDCPRAGHGHICVAEGHWESRSIKDFLRSAED